MFSSIYGKRCSFWTAVYCFEYYGSAFKKPAKYHYVKLYNKKRILYAYNAISKEGAELCMDRKERSKEVRKNLEVIAVNVVAVLRLFAVMDIRGNKVVWSRLIVKFYSFVGSSEWNNRTGNAHVNVILMLFRPPSVAVQNNYYRFWVCVCSLRYPACTAHIPYYVGYSESKYCLRISLAHPRDCHFAHVQWLPLTIEKP